MLWRLIPAEIVFPSTCCAFWLCVVLLSCIVNIFTLIDNPTDTRSSPTVISVPSASNNSSVKVHSSETPPAEHFTTGYIYGLRARWLIENYIYVYYIANFHHLHLWWPLTLSPEAQTRWQMTTITNKLNG